MSSELPSQRPGQRELSELIRTNILPGNQPCRCARAMARDLADQVATLLTDQANADVVLKSLVRSGVLDESQQDRVSNAGWQGSQPPWQRDQEIVYRRA